VTRIWNFGHCVYCPLFLGATA